MHIDDRGPMGKINRKMNKLIYKVEGNEDGNFFRSQYCDEREFPQKWNIFGIMAHGLRKCAVVLCCGVEAPESGGFGVDVIEPKHFDASNSNCRTVVCRLCRFQ